MYFDDVSLVPLLTWLCFVLFVFQVSTKKAQEWCNAKSAAGIALFETSAMDDINVECAFDAVARCALQRGEQDDDL